MLILILHAGNDPVCVGWNLCQAVNKYTPHKARHIIGEYTFMREGSMVPYATDIIAKDYGKEKLKELINEADVLHFSSCDWTTPVSGESYSFGDLMTRSNQKIIYHGHGGAWLLDPTEQIKRCGEKKAKMVTCSPIDEVVVPGILWMPNILYLEDRDLMPDWNRTFQGQLIASMASHSPLYKGGAIAEYVFEYLQKFGYDVKFEIISGLIRSNAFKKRAAHHFTIDNWTQGFFGMAGLEGLALGHIVITRLDPLVEKQWTNKFGELPPIENVKGMDEAAKVIREYYEDRDRMFRHSQKNRKWIEQKYSEEKIVKFWQELYES